MTLKQPAFSITPEGDGYTVMRDDKALQTPRTMSVTVPTRRLAEAIVEECVGQGEKLDLRQMPLTQMTLTAIDISAHHRQDVVKGIMKFGENELVCQRASEPADLVAEQDKIWTPYLDWCQTKFKVELRTGTGIVPFEQNPQALATLREFVETFDPFILTGISEAVGISGSLVLGLALVTGRADAAAVFEASELDHRWQTQKWGDDPVTEGRHAEIKREIELCAKWFSLLG